MFSVSVRYLLYQPMDEKIKTWPLRFPAKKTLVGRKHCSIGQSCCSMTSKRSIYAFLRVLGHEIFSPERRLTNQKPRAFNMYPFNKTIKSFYFCSFAVSVFVRAFSFQGHTKIALTCSDPG